VSVGLSVAMTGVFLAVSLAVVGVDLQDRVSAEDIGRDLERNTKDLQSM